MSCLAESWDRSWSNLGLRPHAGLCQQLLQAYSEPQRHYHSLQHLEECVAHFVAAKELATHAGEVEIALWFHDAIYEPDRKENELRSAEWAKAALKAANARPDVQQRVYALILSTRHDAAPSDPDQRLLVDIDLAILGATPARFAEYGKQVRAEYGWVPEDVYTMKRKAVLKGFLARQPLYNTSHFRGQCETQARVNLAAAVAVLG